MASIVRYCMFSPPIVTLAESATQHNHHETIRRKYPLKLHRSDFVVGEGLHPSP